MLGPGVHACTIGSTHSAVRYFEELFCERASVAQLLLVRYDHVRHKAFLMRTGLQQPAYKSGCGQPSGDIT